MRKMRILLSVKSNAQYYIDAVEGVGAEAVAEYLPTVDTNYDGLILCGGNDIAPKYYGEAVDGTEQVDDMRDDVEFKLLKAFIDAGKPVLGICRGYQLINVFFGGTLYQHLPEANLHRSCDGVDLTHNVVATNGSVLHSLYGESFAVNSSHHQNVKQLGRDLIPTAYWNDKYVEAYEHKTLSILGVQWHPERMCFSKERSDTVCGADIFRHFVNLCKGN